MLQHLVLRAALAACAMAALQANAVFLDSSGIGQALLYPYYNVRSSGGNAFNTYISVANTFSDAPTVAKVRFREGRDSRVVLEFNVYLAGSDTWTGALVPDGAGARLITRDGSCTSPAIPAEGLPLQTTAFAAGDDLAGTGAERTTEGHVEIIAMAQVQGLLDCAQFQAGNLAVLGTMSAPDSALQGSATLINVASGLDAGYNAEALAGLTSVPFYSPPGQPGTDFDAPQVDAVSQITTRVPGGHVFSYRLAWPNGLAAVNSVLAASQFENDYVLDAATASRTDWVLTFPTRHLMVTNSTAQAPFVPFVPTSRAPCMAVQAQAYDREGRRVDHAQSDLPGFYPECWSTGVISFRVSDTSWVPADKSDVLGSANTTGAAAGLFNSDFTARPAALGISAANGRAVMSVTGGTQMPPSLPTSTWLDVKSGTTGTGSVQVFGVPAIGFMVRSFTNGTLSCGATTCQGNYASAFPHRRGRLIQPVQ